MVMVSFSLWRVSVFFIFLFFLFQGALGTPLSLHNKDKHARTQHTHMEEIILQGV
jgi:hypothetical protein